MRGQRIGVQAQRLGAVEAGVLKRESGRCLRLHRPPVQTEKLLPQPQVVFALGLRMTNCAPCRLSR
jgi:hypothetical protein